VPSCAMPPALAASKQVDKQKVLNISVSLLMDSDDSTLRVKKAEVSLILNQ
jgi:hypothetical protein